PLDVLLALHIAEVYVVVSVRREDCGDVDARRLDRALAAQELERIGERRDRDDVDLLNHRCFRRVLGRQEHPAQALLSYGCGHRKSAAYGLDPAVERKLA